MKVFLITICLLHLNIQTVTGDHHDIDIPKNILKRIQNSNASNNEWEFDQKILQNLNYIIEILETKWKSKFMTSSPNKEKPSTATTVSSTAPRQTQKVTEATQHTTSTAFKQGREDNEQHFVCPDPWPFHDIVPVDEQPCEDNSECPSDTMCCRLYNSLHCLKPVDNRPKSGNCPPLPPFELVTEFPPPCKVDYNGCQFDSQCGGQSKCCPTDCHYHQCTEPAAPTTTTKEAPTTTSNVSFTTTQAPTTTSVTQSTTTEKKTPTASALTMRRRNGSALWRLARARMLSSEAVQRRFRFPIHRRN